jgi:hypothetical protein
VKVNKGHSGQHLVTVIKPCLFPYRVSGTVAHSGGAVSGLRVHTWNRPGENRWKAQDQTFASIWDLASEKSTSFSQGPCAHPCGEQGTS